MPTTRPSALLGLLTTLAIGGSCSPELITACPSVGWSRLAVHVRDAETLLRIADGASLTAVSTSVADDPYVYTSATNTDRTEPLRLPDMPAEVITYTLSVSRPGYQTWVRSDVMLPANACSKHTEMVAFLVRAP